MLAKSGSRASRGLDGGGGTDAEAGGQVYGEAADDGSASDAGADESEEALRKAEQQTAAQEGGNKQLDSVPTRGKPAPWRRISYPMNSSARLSVECFSDFSLR